MGGQDPVRQMIEPGWRLTGLSVLDDLTYRVSLVDPVGDIRLYDMVLDHAGTGLGRLPAWRCPKFVADQRHMPAAFVLAVLMAVYAVHNANAPRPIRMVFRSGLNPRGCVPDRMRWVMRRWVAQLRR
jgi:hypothetical protein